MDATSPRVERRTRLMIAAGVALALFGCLAMYLRHWPIPGQSRVMYIALWIATTGIVAWLIVAARWTALKVLGLAMLSGAGLTVCFAPFPFWPIAYVALVPFVLACHVGRDSKLTLWMIGLAGVVYWSVNLYWLTWITAIGHSAGCTYLSVYWIGAAWILRRLMRAGFPCWIALPIAWIPMELFRNFFVPFPWYFLAHSQFMHTTLIQVSDVTGQLGVSFFVAMVGGLIADVILVQVGARPRRPTTWVPGLAVCAACLIGMLIYGAFRLGQDTKAPGPVIAVLQGAEPSTLYDPKNMPYAGRALPFYIEETSGLGDVGCDLIVWPESIVYTGLVDMPRLDVEQLPDEAIRNLGLLAMGAPPEGMSVASQRETLAGWASDLTEWLVELQQLADEAGCPILTGGPGLRLNGDNTWYQTNDAVWIDPDGEYQPSYAKLGLVPFSEYIPFRQTCRPVFNFLQSFVPPGMRNTQPGTEIRRFVFSRGDEQWTLATPICFEGTISRIARKMVFDDGRKQADILVNLSNDGWFVYQGRDGEYRLSTEHMAHFVPYIYRAVENRVPVVRSVNTGISAWIDSDGVVIEAVGGEGGKMGAGTRIKAATVVFPNPLPNPTAGANNMQETSNLIQNGSCSDGVMVDKRTSIYSFVGDTFAWVVALVALVSITATSSLKERVKT